LHLKYFITLIIAIFTTNPLCYSSITQWIRITNADYPDSTFLTNHTLLQSSDTIISGRDNTIGNFNATHNDSIDFSSSLPDQPTDSTGSDYPLKNPIYSSAEDSLLYSLDGKMVYLYGNAVVKYENMELSAAYIEYNAESNIVFAEGLPDSTGAIVGKPIFKEGTHVYRMERMHYNFNSKKAKIIGVITEEAGGFLHSQDTKLMDSKTINVSGGKFTTCDLDNPHFYIAITKGKVISGDKLIVGPAYIVLGDVPLPIGLPFGFFPNRKGRSSGILLPEYGEEQNRGFFLRNGGFYLGLNDYFDLGVTGDIYTKGSWAVNTRSNYRKRYRYSGNFSIAISENVFGEKGQDDYIKNRSYWLRWSHSQDPKASPNSTFQASVNLGSPNHNRYNARSVDAFLTNSISSSISYSKNWPGTPFSLSASMNHSQNNLDSTISLGLPKVSFNMSRIYPLKKKDKIGNTTWYENIGLSLSTRFDNSISTKTNKLFTPETLREFKNGAQHNIPVSTSFNILKYFIISPSVNYTENWYTKTIQKRWDPDSVYVQSGDTIRGRVVTDEILGFARAWQYSTGVSMNTKIYGMFRFGQNSPVQAIRHVMTPSVGLSYRPDFSREHYGFYKTVQSDSTGNKFETYSIFEQSLFGGPGSGKSGLLNLSLSNNLEMKVRSSRDTTTNFRKIKIFENLSFNTSYNMLADSMRWSPVTFSARTTLFEKFNIDFSGTLNPYALDSHGKISRHFLFTQHKTPFRVTNARASFNFSLKGGDKQGGDQSGKPGLGQMSDVGFTGSDMGDPLFGQAIGTEYSDTQYTDYVDFNVPWSIRVDYSFNYAKQTLISTINQSVNFSGDINLTPKWKIGFYSGYDIKTRKLTTTSINFYRDLHCWEMRLSVVPIGFLKSFSFNINVKSATLKDLKYSKRKSYQDNF